MLFKLFQARQSLSAKPKKSIPLILPAEIISQIVGYVLQEEDWITAYRLSPRWRQQKFEAEIEDYIIRQRRIDSIRLESVSSAFLAQVTYELQRSVREQRKQVDVKQNEAKKDDQVVRFLVEECEMLEDVVKRLERIQDGVTADAGTKFTWSVRRLSFLKQRSRES